MFVDFVKRAGVFKISEVNTSSLVLYPTKCFGPTIQIDSSQPVHSHHVLGLQKLACP